MTNELFTYEQSESYKAALHFSEASHQLSNCLNNYEYKALSQRTLKAATELVMTTAAAADGSLREGERAEKVIAAREAIMHCAVLVDVAATLKLHSAPPLQPLRRILDRVAAGLPSSAESDRPSRP